MSHNPDLALEQHAVAQFAEAGFVGRVHWCASRLSVWATGETGRIVCRFTGTSSDGLYHVAAVGAVNA